MRVTNRELWNAGLLWGGDPTLMGAKPPKDRAPRKVREVPSEWREQATLVTWWWRYAPTKQLDVRYLFAIPNGAHLAGDTSQREIQMSRLKSAGLRPGVPDLMLAIPKLRLQLEYHGLYIEMKRIDGSVAPEQTEYHELLMKMGYAVNVCYGAQQGINVIKAYLG